MNINAAMQPRKLLVLVLLSVSLIFLQGCGSGRKGITIDSDPRGADILADGKNIGKTPMEIQQDDVFPPRWYGRTYMVKGQLEIQKEGCEDFNMDVNDFVLSSDINASLKCTPGMMQTETPVTPAAAGTEVQPAAPAAKSVTPAATATSSPAKKSSAAGSDEVENRLTRLKALHDRGVISDEEYATQRKRILESI